MVSLLRHPSTIYTCFSDELHLQTELFHSVEQSKTTKIGKQINSGSEVDEVTFHVFMQYSTTLCRVLTILM